MAYCITDQCNGCGLCMKICPADAIAGEKKERHRIAPSLCIECGGCGRICAADSVEDPFREPCRHMKKQTWPKPEFDYHLCMRCSICIEECPSGAIFLSGAAAGKRRDGGIPVLADGNLCIACGFCAEECPVQAIRMAVQ